MSQNDRMTQAGRMPDTRGDNTGSVILAVIVVVIVLAAIYFVARAYWAPNSPTPAATTEQLAPAPLPALSPNSVAPAMPAQTPAPETSPAPGGTAAPAPAQ